MGVVTGFGYVDLWCCQTCSYEASALTRCFLCEKVAAMLSACNFGEGVSHVDIAQLGHLLDLY